MQQLHNQMDSCSGHAKPIVSFNALEGCYSIQLAQLEFGNDKNLLDQAPEYLHDVNTGLRYQQEDDSSKATHHLHIIGGKTVKLIEMKSGPSSTSQNYVQL